MSDKEETKTESAQEETSEQTTTKWADAFKKINSDTKETDLIGNLKNENKKLKESLLSIMAELENTRKRYKEELEKTAKYSISKLIEELIPVMESFYLIIDNKPKEENILTSIKSYLDGIDITFKELQNIFDKNGVKRIFPLNEKFNHNYHQAIVRIENSEIEEGTVVKVIQAGYIIKDRLIKPALVGVSFIPN